MSFALHMAAANLIAFVVWLILCLPFGGNRHHLYALCILLMVGGLVKWGESK